VIAQLLTVAETALGTDGLAIGVRLTAADAGLGADAASVGAAVVVSDAGAGGDVPQVVVTVLVADLGRAADALAAVFAALQVSDVAHGAEVVVHWLQQQITRVDVGITLAGMAEIGPLFVERQAGPSIVAGEVRTSAPLVGRIEVGPPADAGSVVVGDPIGGD
jgi:hypothetical protein